MCAFVFFFLLFLLCSFLFPMLHYLFECSLSHSSCCVCVPRVLFCLRDSIRRRAPRALFSSGVHRSSAALRAKDAIFGCDTDAHCASTCVRSAATPAAGDARFLCEQKKNSTCVQLLPVNFTCEIEMKRAATRTGSDSATQYDTSVSASELRALPFLPCDPVSLCVSVSVCVRHVCAVPRRLSVSVCVRVQHTSMCMHGGRRIH